jgi:hypothetical protein
MRPGCIKQPMTMARARGAAADGFGRFIGFFCYFQTLYAGVTKHNSDRYDTMLAQY